MLPIGDHMPLRDAVEGFRAINAHGGDEAPHGAPVVRPRVLGGEIGQPQAFRRNGRQHVKGMGKVGFSGGSGNELRHDQ